MFNDVLAAMLFEDIDRHNFPDIRVGTLKRSLQ